MRSKGLAFADVLKEAQAKGYAEADPTFDIEGVDAGHKKSASALAFGIPLSFDKAHVEGITKLKPSTSATPRRWATASLLGIARRRGDGSDAGFLNCAYTRR